MKRNTELIDLLCVGCKHFMPIEEVMAWDDSRLDLSECRRHAPYAHTSTGWPRTHAGNWCGDHEKDTEDEIDLNLPIGGTD